ncbi:MAG TPA: hypothetical protein VJ957_03690, partial [Longimicrobiales bacterium]|nr:hypothetical protein [Longimicrobiales bacterium]
WAWTNRMLAAARELGITTQVDTTISRSNLHDFDRLAELVKHLDVALWSVFCLVPMGRAAADEGVEPAQLESVFQRMYNLSLAAPFEVKTTAAPQYRRVMLQRQVAARRADPGRRPPRNGLGFTLPDEDGAAKGVGDGNGFLFISHAGDIYPSGFLPISAGNVRTDDVVDVYRNAPLFRALRDRSRLKGKCGVCEYRDVCGGSRARAFAATGDYLEADPLCTHVPLRYARRMEAGGPEPLDG